MPNEHPYMTGEPIHTWSSSEHAWINAHVVAVCASNTCMTIRDQHGRTAHTATNSHHVQPDNNGTPSFTCRTVGELLTSIAYLIERGETTTALQQARDCAADPTIRPTPLLPAVDEGNQ